MTIETTRRALIAAIPAVAVLATIPAAALETDSPADRRDWDHAMARYSAAAKAADDYDTNVFDPAYERQTAFETANGVVHKQDANGGWTPDYSERREALYATLGMDHRVPDHIHDERERLTDTIADARDDLMDVPAPDLAALRWKLDYLTEGGTGFETVWVEYIYVQTLADIARLLPEGG